jgi:hypothetical protein
MHRATSFVFATALLLGGGATAEQTATITKSARAGPYLVTLEVLPAQWFTGEHPTLTWDGGAEPVEIGGRVEPNHDLAIYVTRDGQPVLDKDVAARYRPVAFATSEWSPLPVARVHDAGKALSTTHYGNNVRLSPGRWEVAVTVDGRPSVVFHFALPVNR